MKWLGDAKKAKKYKVVLIKDYVEVINTALEQKANWHFSQNKKKGDVMEKVNNKTRASKIIGKVIVCPKCDKESRVYHFSWSGKRKKERLLNAKKRNINTNN